MRARTDHGDQQQGHRATPNGFVAVTDALPPERRAVQGGFGGQGLARGPVASPRLTLGVEVRDGVAEHLTARAHPQARRQRDAAKGAVVDHAVSSRVDRNGWRDGRGGQYRHGLEPVRFHCTTTIHYSVWYRRPKSSMLFVMADDEVEREDVELKAKIGALVRRLRAERDWSQEDLADEARMHTNHVGFVERGQKMPTVGALRRIARALGLKVSEFLGLVGE